MENSGVSTNLPGFTDPVMNSQKVFRAILRAMSRPGLATTLPSLPEAPGRLSPASAAVALTLLDLHTPIWLSPALDQAEVANYLRFHCGAPMTKDPTLASFAILDEKKRALNIHRFNQGTSLYPDASTTLIIQVDDFSQGIEMIVSGPGVIDRVRLSVDGLPPAFIPEFNQNRQNFPLGVDCFLVSSGEICGLPRTVCIEG